MKIINKNRQEKGITLIALVITIIILLILAVVSIRLVVNNGVLGKEETAVKAYSESETEEKVKLAYSDYQMGKLTDSSYTFETALQNGKVAYTSVTGSDAEGYIVTATLSDGKTKQYSVTSTGVSKIKDLEDYGLKIGDYVAYDATKDENGRKIYGEKATYTSYSVLSANEDPTRNNGRSSGYTEDQEFSIKYYDRGWRVLGVKNGHLQLISADLILPLSGSGYYLKGQKGYTDGPAELNAIAGMFGQGKGAEGARSVDVKDINDITGYKPEKTGDGKPCESGTISEYLNKVTYYWDGTNYPYYEYGEGGRKKTGSLGDSHNSSFNWYDGSNWRSSQKDTNASKGSKSRITELTSTSYYYFPTTLTTSLRGDTKGIAETSKEWDVLFTFKKTLNYNSYWLASVFEYCGYNNASFGVKYVGRERVDDAVMFNSCNDVIESNGGVRPVVSLKYDITIEKTDTNDGSTLAKACILK